MVITDYDVHPAALAFPMMQEREYRELVQDIREHGQRQPCAIYLGMLIDGRNRLKACQELGIEPLVQEVSSDTDPVDYVVSMNLMRRQLSPSQRSMVAATLATLKRGGDRGNQHTGGKVSNDTLASLDEAADMLQIGRATVARAKKVIEHGAEELADAVRRDAVPVSLAAKLVDAEPDKQVQAQLALQGSKAVQAHLGIQSGVRDTIYEMIKERPRTKDELLAVSMHFQSAIRAMRLNKGINIQTDEDGRYFLSQEPLGKRAVMPYDKVADAFAKLAPKQKTFAMRRINADPHVAASRIKSMEKASRKGDGTATDDMTQRLEECMNAMHGVLGRCEGRRGAWLVKVDEAVISDWLRMARDIAGTANRLAIKLSEEE